MAVRTPFALLLLLSSWLHIEAIIPSKVIDLQQVLYGELQLLERSSLNVQSRSPHSGQAYADLRTVFDEFERQNQESISAILRVLALVDHTLENTIKDCAKIFDLSALDSRNVIFRDVTRPLLVRVEELCQLLASDQLDNLEPIMEAVEKEASLYRVRLDATKRSIDGVLSWLGKEVPQLWIAKRVDETFARWQLTNSTAYLKIMPAIASTIDRQRSVYVLLSQASLKDSIESQNFLSSVDRFMSLLANETELLENDVAVELQGWLNETEEMVQIVAEEAVTILNNLLNAPASAFLQGESSLDCLAEYYAQSATHNIWSGVDNVFGCFNNDKEILGAFEMASQLLGIAERDIHYVLQGLASCSTRAAPAEIDIDLMNCSEAAKSILEVAEEFVVTKMNEVYFHIADALNFGELKLETCLYEKARHLLLDVYIVNQQYRDCNAQQEPQLDHDDRQTTNTVEI
ncbi:uncharacterized protein LOC128270393 [Anopheles cruzii]|uniref:uncharacterized protein LOC128270393 n=1 Tax=Anopheles cruzii TaxID=68878 RepID=UPI0022EC7773|nr:uncharacterized protein LOC128270393 [Anopheles cruzii]